MFGCCCWVFASGLRDISGSLIAFLTATATDKLSGPTVGAVCEYPVEGKCVPIPACISCWSLNQMLVTIEITSFVNKSILSLSKYTRGIDWCKLVAKQTDWKLATLLPAEHIFAFKYFVSWHYGLQAINEELLFKRSMRRWFSKNGWTDKRIIYAKVTAHNFTLSLRRIRRIFFRERAIVYNFIIQAFCLANCSFLAMFHHFSQCDTYSMDAFSYYKFAMSRSTFMVR